MRVYIIVIILLISSNLFAHTMWQKKSANQTESWILYSEEDKWFADYFVEKRNDLQERIEQHSFKTQSEANEFIYTKTFDYVETAQARALNPIGIRFPGVARTLWTVTKEWNEEWERAFEHWFATQFSPQYFVQYNLETDCADAAYLSRWIFARNNQLPAAAQLAGTNALFTHETVRSSWQNLPSHENWWEDQLFMTALNYLASTTFTHTLNLDTYPIEVNSTYVIPGAIYLTLNATSGHTRLFYTFGPNSSIKIMSSTTPRKVRPLNVENFRTSTPAPQGSGGIVRFLWPYKNGSNWQLRTAEEMRGYSLEQYQSEFLNEGEFFYQAVTRRIFPSQEDQDYTDMKIGLESVVEQLERRIPVVNEGHTFCNENLCEEESENYENWSTPSRDQRIYESVYQVYSLYKRTQDPRVLNLWNNYDFNYSLQIHPSFTFNWKNIIQIFLEKKYSSDPNDQILSRWGISTPEKFDISTTNPYANNSDLTWFFSVPDGSRAILRFGAVSMEARHDFLKVTDQAGASYTYSGDYPNLSTPPLRGIVTVSFTSDAATTKAGFQLRKVDLISDPKNSAK